ncbi:hypothetical protein BCR33DRAFT_155276 [Rhizoclosmatium globosum]|uniref:Na+/solute symporter n=1 Tax=Rhizoclosmatium globosum TaxID=329046 RepID=A0A1Y2CHY3_9FUNG|nr:hypothetical protein BCR33DRAFT_155276 [Rhizoclosmatium globosum]|eukprot:ORY45925.1 hypothetical protein BCR33DRAFT_155276 [Rhizoclosmatium globosum]
MSTTSSYSSTNTTQSVFLDPQSANTGLILCILAYVSYGILAIAFSFLKDARKKNKTTDFIITARHSQSLWWSAASWFSCGIGAFTLFGPADFVVDPSIGTGIIGLLVYSIFSGIPLVWVARIGSTVRKNVPQATSVSSYAQWRFGKEVQIFVLFLVLFILTINLLDEYLVIGTIFAQFFGCSPHVPIVTVGIITMVYTGFGGLYVSILTDLYQTVLVLLLVFVSVIWMIYSFCGVSFPSLPDYLGSTAAGWKTIATIGIPFTCGTFFGEAFWQRCWSADSEKSLRYGSLIGGLFRHSLFYCWIWCFLGLLVEKGGYC